MLRQGLNGLRIARLLNPICFVQEGNIIGKFRAQANTKYPSNLTTPYHAEVLWYRSKRGDDGKSIGVADLRWKLV